MVSFSTVEAKYEKLKELYHEPQEGAEMIEEKYGTKLQQERQENIDSLYVVESKYEELKKQYQESQKSLQTVEHDLQLANARLNHIYNSNMYKLSLKYYKLRDMLLPQNSRARFIIKSIFLHKKQTVSNQIDRFHAYGMFEQMDIISTKHTMFIALLLKKQLNELKIKCEIYTSELEEYKEIPYIIICPQFIQKFPKVYIAFQMEQTISSRWFTKDYFIKLKNSCAILDYSLQNVEFFHKPENEDVRSRVYYLPVDYYTEYRKIGLKEKEYDVLFYGDLKYCERRQKMISELKNHFNVKVCSEVFGEELYQEIEKAKVVINIHYYENALLETTRLYEVLSLNTCVIVSEKSKDKREEERLEGIVDFVEIDDIKEMIEHVNYWLVHETQRLAKIKENKAVLEQRPNAFSFFFKRFLLAYDRIPFDVFYQAENRFVTLNTNRICLSLPESTQRRKAFDEDNHYGFQCIPGLRHEKGWVGCGLSYKFIFKKAAECGMEKLMICEDDVIFPENFEQELAQIIDKLNAQEKWSIFSGVMADVGRIKVSDCIKDEDGYLIKINHMVSMVFNIYNREMFELFLKWDEQNRDVQKNAIDRYLESKDLSVYVKLPFLVGHKEELDSTIWGFSNVQYASMIEKCQNTLLETAKEYENERGI